MRLGIFCLFDVGCEVFRSVVAFCGFDFLFPRTFEVLGTPNRQTGTSYLGLRTPRITPGPEGAAWELQGCPEASVASGARMATGDPLYYPASFGVDVGSPCQPETESPCTLR